MAYNKKYAELGESVIDYVNNREDAIGSEFNIWEDTGLKVNVLSGENSIGAISRTGIYYSSGGWTGNVPTTWGWVIVGVLPGDTTMRFQIFISNQGHMSSRVLWREGSWRPWRNVTY